MHTGEVQKDQSESGRDHLTYTQQHNAHNRYAHQGKTLSGTARNTTQPYGSDQSPQTGHSTVMHTQQKQQDNVSQNKDRSTR